MKNANGFLLFLIVITILFIIGLVKREPTSYDYLYEKDKPFAERSENPDPPLTSTGEKFTYDSLDFAANILQPGSELTLKRNIFIENGSVVELSNKDDKVANASSPSHIYFSRCYISLQETNSGVIKAGSRIKINRITDAFTSPVKDRLRKGAFAFMGTTENGTMVKIEIVSGLWLRASSNFPAEGEYDPTMRDVEAFFSLSLVKGPKEI